MNNNNNNNSQRQSRWGAAPPHHQAPVDNNEKGRDRSQSWNDPRRGGRGYDTTDAPGRINRDVSERGGGHDDSRGGRWGDRRNSRDEKDHYRAYENERHHHHGREEEEDWKCQECGLSNDPRDECCPRCRTWSSSSRQGDSGPAKDGRRSFDDGDRTAKDSRRSFDDGDRYHRRGNDREVRNGDADDGHYGPPSSSGGSRRGRDDDYDNDRRRPRKKLRDDSPPLGREWPPHFESAGASFLFDARSGMFYEPSSDFFYDPKTKLYYSNKKQQYFRYDEDKKPHAFQPIGEVNGAGGQLQQGKSGGQGVEGVVIPKVVTEAEEIHAAALPGLNATEMKPEKVEPKPKIAISLKTALPQNDGGVKSLNEVTATEKTKLKEKNVQRKESALSIAAENNALPQAHKKHAKDMNKWSDRVRDEDTSEVKPPASKKVKTTVSGQPICVLCRRKFANLEKLQQHEKLSALHKENLDKKAATDAAAAAKDCPQKEPEMSYRDRSKERRSMYGSHAAPISSHAEALLAHSLGSSSSEKKHAQVIRPEETLNDSNVGNKLLQKLGWKSGEVLGRNANQDTAGNGLVTKKNDVASNLKSDWERIESLAQRGGRR